MHNRSIAEAREVARILAMLSVAHVPKAYLNDNCLPRAP